MIAAQTSNLKPVMNSIDVGEQPMRKSEST